MTDDFKKDLEELFNRHGMDNETNTPDFILAEMVAEFIGVYATMMAKTMTWHGWPSLDQKLTEAVNRD